MPPSWAVPRRRVRGGIGCGFVLYLGMFGGESTPSAAEAQRNREFYIELKVAKPQAASTSITYDRPGSQIMQSVMHAIRGIGTSLLTQKHMRIHVFAAVAVIAGGFWLAVSPGEWTVLMLTIAFVFAAELLNTAIESTVDLVTTEYHPQAKVAKDAAAGAVLIAAIASIIVGLVIFGPRMWSALAA